MLAYQQFREHIEEYGHLYNNGLKKQANQFLSDFVKAFQMPERQEKDPVLYCFTRDLCDEKQYAYLKNRGNGAIPFALAECLREWLYPRCMDNYMPELRWYYELYCQDQAGHEVALDFLKRAYESKACDSKTVQLYFGVFIKTLAWGAHHFPEACIITEETRRDAFRKCHRILSEKIVSEQLKAQLTYYEALYSCFDNYVHDGKKKDFTQYCNEANLAFYESKAYAYNSR